MERLGQKRNTLWWKYHLCPLPPSNFGPEGTMTTSGQKYKEGTTFSVYVSSKHTLLYAMCYKTATTLAILDIQL